MLWPFRDLVVKGAAQALQCSSVSMLQIETGVKEVELTLLIRETFMAALQEKIVEDSFSDAIWIQLKNKMQSL